MIQKQDMVFTAVSLGFVVNSVLFLFSVVSLKNSSSSEKLIWLSTFLLTSIQNWLVPKRKWLMRHQE